MPTTRVLISGIGIAGPTLAYWLSVDGVQSTLVERAARLRTGGYAIDFWDADTTSLNEWESFQKFAATVTK